MISGAERMHKEKEEYVKSKVIKGRIVNCLGSRSCWTLREGLISPSGVQWTWEWTAIYLYY